MAQRGYGWNIFVERDDGEDWDAEHPTMQGMDLEASLEARNALVLRHVVEAFPGAYVEATFGRTDASIAAEEEHDTSLDAESIYDEVTEVVLGVDQYPEAYLVRRMAQ